MMSLAIDNAARDSMMQLTGQNRFTRSLSGSYKMTNGSRASYSLRTREAITESTVRESTGLAVMNALTGMANQWRWPCLIFL